MSATPEIPVMMTAITITEPGGPLVLKSQPRPVPSPRPGEILVKVKAAGVNRPDVLQRLGGYPPPPGASPLPGLEVAGEVVALGEGVESWELGDHERADMITQLPGGRRRVLGAG